MEKRVSVTREGENKSPVLDSCTRVGSLQVGSRAWLCGGSGGRSPTVAGMGLFVKKMWGAGSRVIIRCAL